MPNTKSLDIEAPTLEEARSLVATHLETLTHNEAETLKETIVSAGAIKRSRCGGPTNDEAFAIASKYVPVNAVQLERNVISPAVIDIVDVEAYSNDEARSIADNTKKQDYNIGKIELDRASTRGLFGLGRRKGRYSVETIKYAVVEIVYREVAIIQLTWQVADSPTNSNPKSNADAAAIEINATTSEFRILKVTDYRGTNRMAKTVPTSSRHETEQELIARLRRIAKVYDGDNPDPKRRAETVDIGEKLNRLGGFKLMKRVLDKDVGYCAAQGWIDMVWSGIGEWLG